VTILIVLDSPEGEHHGGMVGGPVFKRIAEQVLAYLDVPRDVPSPSDTETAKNLHPNKEMPARKASATDATKARFESAIAKEGRQKPAQTVAFGSPGSIVVPNLSGQSVRDVTEACLRLGLVPSLIGSGVALQEFPEAGTNVLRGSRLTVWFGRPGEQAARGDGN
jgi:hypothetical protein